jgi:hypothetical protein
MLPTQSAVFRGGALGGAVALMNAPKADVSLQSFQNNQEIRQQQESPSTYTLF